LQTATKYASNYPHIGGGGFMGGHVYYHAPAKRCRVSIPFNGVQEKFWKVKINGNWIPIWDKKTGTKLLSLMQADIDKGCFDPRTYRPDSPLSIKEFAESWLKTSSASKNTKKVYRNAIKHVIEHFGEDQDIRAFTHSKLLLFMQSLNLSGSAKYNILTALKTMLRFYQKDVPTFVLPIFPPLTKPEPETTAYLTFEEQQKVLGAIPERHRPIFIVMMEYGIRPQEATALKWDCVDDKTITFKRSHSEYELRETTKTGDKGIRVEEITTRAREALAAARSFPSFQGWVFGHNQRGSHYDNKILNKIWRSSSATVGVKIGLYEAVRHSLGCQLSDEGFSIDFIQDVYKHTSIKTTRRYAKRQRGMISAALENRGQVVAFKKSENQ
jgi:integrase